MNNVHSLKLVQKWKDDDKLTTIKKNKKQTNNNTHTPQTTEKLKPVYKKATVCRV